MGTSAPGPRCPAQSYSLARMGNTCPALLLSSSAWLHRSRWGESREKAGVTRRGGASPGLLVKGTGKLALDGCTENLQRGGNERTEGCCPGRRRRRPCPKAAEGQRAEERSLGQRAEGGAGRATAPSVQAPERSGHRQLTWTPEAVLGIRGRSRRPEACAVRWVSE